MLFIVHKKMVPFSILRENLSFFLQHLVFFKDSNNYIRMEQLFKKICFMIFIFLKKKNKNLKYICIELKSILNTYRDTTLTLSSLNCFSTFSNNGPSMSLNCCIICCVNWWTVVFQ